MHSTQSLPDSIAGTEPLVDGNTALAALVAFYRAFNARDLRAMEGVWLNDDQASMDNPIGGIRRGWQSIREGYEKLFNGTARVFVEFHDYTLQGDDHFALAVGRERGHFEQGRVRINLAIRTTRLFVRQNGHWRQVHHHGSIEDGALLADYQRAILGAPIRVTS